MLDVVVSALMLLGNPYRVSRGMIKDVLRRILVVYLSRARQVSALKHETCERV